MLVGRLDQGMGVMLMGGARSETTTEIVYLNGTVVAGYDLKDEFTITYYLSAILKYILKLCSYGCAISDENEIVLTGGFSTKRVAKYNRTGFVWYIPDMLNFRRQHSCASFINSDNFKVQIYDEEFLHACAFFIGVSSSRRLEF